MPVPLASEDMAVDEPALTAAQEKDRVNQLTEAAEGRVQEGDTFYLISHRWWRVWKNYADAADVSSVDNGDGTPLTSGSFVASKKRPFSIDNSDLVVSTASSADQKCEPELRENLVEDRDYVLTPEQVWLALDKWYGGGPALPRKVITVGSGSHEDLFVEVYPLQLHLLVVPLGSKSSLKVSKQDTIGKLHQMICEHFKLEEPEKVRIWDYFNKDKNKLLTDSGKNLTDALLNMNQDILVEVQINGRWPDENTSVANTNGTSGRETSVLSESRSIANGPLASKTGVKNASLVQHPLHSVDKDLKEADGWLGSSSCAGRLGPKGLSGLQNLGNTCFMNSALQCLVHTPPLAIYFMQDYSREINRHNPLGMEGELALAFGELLRKLWAPGKQPVAPRPFKTKLARFAPQFSGYNQHDSQELLAFLLDGLHEDLNRVKNKPYVEAKDANGRPDREVAAEYWANHRSRNDSVIVDVCQGQYKSTLVCPVCSKVSVTFDPFMYLSLPLPAKTTRTMTVTVFSGVGSAPPTSYTVTVPRQGRYKDLIHAVGIACNLGNDERLLLAELYNHRIFRLLEEPQEWLTAVRDDDRLAAYRLPKQTDKGPLLVLLHRHLEMETLSTKSNLQWKLFAAPLITHIPEELATGAELLKIVNKLLSPMESSEPPVRAYSMEMDVQSTIRETAQDDVEMAEPNSESAQSHAGDADGDGQLESVSSNANSFEPPFQLWTTDDKGTLREGPILMDKPVPPASNSARASSKMRYVAVDWSSAALEERFEMSKADMPPEVLKTGLPATSSKKARQEAVSLYTCLESFLKEEPLGPDDMCVSAKIEDSTWSSLSEGPEWTKSKYCPSCKEHRQASKKLDLWRLPEILVVHLKRFSYSRFLKNKLETFVNFPVLDLDLSSYVASTSEPQGHKYELYAISNHYGSMGGGHYTAYAKLIDENKWYNFDDSHVSSVSEGDVKTSAAYVLFYRRIPSDESSTTDEPENRVKAHVSSNRDLPVSSETSGNKSNLSSI